jgi:hypothetical protein
VTLAMTYVRSDEDEADAVERVLARVENYPFEVDLLLADSGFYNERVIRRARDIVATVVHVPKKGERMKEKLDTHESYMTTYRMYKDREREQSGLPARFPKDCLATRSAVLTRSSSATPIIAFSTSLSQTHYGLILVPSSIFNRAS